MGKTMVFVIDNFDIELVYDMTTGKPIALEIGLTDEGLGYASARIPNKEVLNLANWLLVYIETHIK